MNGWRILTRVGHVSGSQALCAGLWHMQSQALTPQNLIGGSERLTIPLPKATGSTKKSQTPKPPQTEFFPRATREPVSDGCNTDLGTPITLLGLSMNQH